MADNIYIGSDLKINVSFKVGSQTMDDMQDFSCEFIAGRIHSVVPKSGMVRVDKDNYIACIKADKTSLGNISCIVTAKVPDVQFAEGYRVEVARFTLDNVII